jgi:hypothetical protein
MGQTSAAYEMATTHQLVLCLEYVGVLAWNTPQGTPAKISAASRASTFGAVKKIVVTAANQTSEAKQTFRYPYRSVAYPLTDHQRRRLLGALTNQTKDLSNLSSIR